MRLFKWSLTCAAALMQSHRRLAATATAAGSSGLRSLLSVELQSSASTFDEKKRQLVISKLKELSPESTLERCGNQVDSFHIPLYLYLRDLLRRHRHRNRGVSPLFVGISAPQGCGKTTLTTLMEILFGDDGAQCISCSIDDFYLRGEEQDALAAANPSNPLLQYRGNAGTHDLNLMIKTLALLRGPGMANVTVPRYDKSLRSGRGDRAAAPRLIDTTKAPVDVVLLEGWMLGFEALPIEQLKPFLESEDLRAQGAAAGAGAGARAGAGAGAGAGLALEQINSLLRDYTAVHSLMDAWLVLAVESPEYVYRWRLQAEEIMGRQGKPRLSDAQVKDFVERFMPAYRTYLPRLYSRGPDQGAHAKVQGLEQNQEAHPDGSSTSTSASTSTSKREEQTRRPPVLKVHLGEARNVVGAEFMYC